MCRTTNSKYSFCDELYTIENLDMQLQSADLVIIAIPGTTETKEMFNSERIKKMKSSAIIVNVGRGFIVNTDILTNTLKNGKLRGAVLDVTDTEPLPENHPLRYMENLKHDSNSETLKNVIDFNKGY